MADVNHLKNNIGRTKVLARASGVHVVRGHLIRSRNQSGTVYARNALAKGIWEGVLGAWYKGVNITSADYAFSNGTQTNATSYFPTDKRAHTGTAMMDFRTTIADTNTEQNPPDAFSGIFKCERFPFFDASGNQINPADSSVVVSYSNLLLGTPLNKSYFKYSVNPAHVLAGWIFLCGNGENENGEIILNKIKISRINWAVWAVFRDYHAATELADYRTLTDFPGFGLTARYYNGSNFETFVTKRIDPTILFATSTGSPAIGVDVSNFSVEYTGYLKPPLTGDYDFRVKHDDGAKLWIDNLATPIINASTYGTTEYLDKALTQNVFYNIRLEWFDGSGSEPNPAEISLEWKKPGETEWEIIPAEYLYPKEESLPRYEAHLAFSTPTTLDQMIETVLFVSNSIKQDVEGKLEFYCIEQLTGSFHFQENSPQNERTIAQQRNENGETRDLISFSRTDRRVSEIQNVFEARFRDLDSQYLEEPLMPVTIKLDDLIEIAGREIYGEPVNLYNMRRWQACKVLNFFVQRNVAKDLVIEGEFTARTYQTIVGDIGQITHSILGGTKTVQCIETTDRSPEESNTRILKFQEW